MTTDARRQPRETPRQTLEQIIRTAQHLHEQWHRYRTVYADLGPANTNAGLGIHVGGPSDPTSSAGLANEIYLETIAELAEALGHLRAVERQMTRTLNHDPSTARDIDAAVRAARCADPVCDDNAVKHGYCIGHWWTHRSTCEQCQNGAA